MATGNGGEGGEMLATLKAILDAQHAQADITQHGFAELRNGFAELRKEIREGLERVNQRLDGIRDIAGERYRDLETRVARLEARFP